MNGKTVVVTGANQGIGKAAAVALGKMGASLLLVCRNAEKGKAAVDEVKAAGAPRAELVLADLASQAEVRRAAAEIRAKVDRIDVLVNNAGVLVPARRTTVDGIEETFAVNHLASFILTNELLDVVKRAPEGRIVNVSSTMHRRGKMKWDDIQLTKGYGSFAAYAQSKLANVLFTHELARRLQGTRATTNSLHPGVIGSGFGQTYGGAYSVFVRLAKPFMLTPQEGARTTVYLASSPEVAGVTGKYFEKCREVASSRASHEPGAAERLWAVSEELTGTKQALSA